MGIAVHHGGVDLHQFKQFLHPLHSLFVRDALVDQDSLGDLFADLFHRVEGVHGTLEDHGDLFPPEIPQFLIGKMGDVFAVEQDLAAFYVAFLREQTDDRQGGGGFAAARFANQADGFALVQIKADAVHRFDLTFGDLKISTKLVDFQ